MIIIDLDKISEIIKPIGGKVLLTKYYNSPAIKCTATPTPEQYEDESLFDSIKNEQRRIVGEAFEEFYTETTMTEWYIYLKRIPIEFESNDEIHAKNWINIHL